MVNQVKATVEARQQVRERMADFAEEVRHGGDIHKLKIKYAQAIPPDVFKDFFKNQSKVLNDVILKNASYKMMMATPPEMPDMDQLPNHQADAKLQANEMAFLKQKFTTLGAKESKVDGKGETKAVKGATSSEGADQGADEFARELATFIDNFSYELLKQQIQAHGEKMKRQAEEFLQRARAMVKNGANPMILIHAAARMLLAENGTHSMSLGIDIKHGQDVQRRITEEITNLDSGDAKIYQYTNLMKEEQQNMQLTMMSVQKCVERSEQILNTVNMMDKEYLRAQLDIQRNIKPS